MTDPIKTCFLTKHRGKSWEEVIEEDPEYVRWVVSYKGPPVSDAQYDYIMELLEEHDESH